jgi:hypothetical protein
MAFLVAEAFLRLAPGVMPEEAQLRLRWQEDRRDIPSVTIPDVHLGFRYPPHARNTISRPDLQFTYTTNGQGFRGQAEWPSTAEIVVVGDSWVFGYGVNDDETWISRLAARLSKSTVVNLGLIGAGPAQYLRVYRTYGVPLEPRLVIVGLFPGNDIADQALFDAWLRAGSPGNYDVWRFFRGDLGGSMRSTLSRSRVLFLAREAWKLRGTRFAGRTFSFPDGSRLHLAPGILSASTARAHPGDPAFDRVVGLLREFRDEAGRHGSRILVLLFPTKERIYLPLLGDTPPELVQPFITELRALGMDMLDLTPVFRRHARAGERLYFDVDGHINLAGNRVLSDTLLQHLRAGGDAYGLSDWLSEAASTGQDSLKSGHP